MGFLLGLFGFIKGIFPDLSSLNPEGDWIFIALILLLIAFLIKPKPLKYVIPSLMFLINRKKKGKLSSFFKKLIRDPLKLIQFITLLLICAAAVMPVWNYERNVSNDKTVLVIDNSASTANQINAVKHHALKNLNGDISVILIRDSPELVAENINKNTAKSVISSLRPSYYGSDISGSLLMADKLINNTGKIVVISDFMNTEDQDLISIINFIKSKNKTLELIDIKAQDEGNAGIINYQFTSKLKIQVKNYNDHAENITMYDKFNNDIKYIDEKLIGPKSIETFEISPEKGLHEISIDPEDSFSEDNRLFLNLPTKANPEILVITNDYEGYLKDFLESSDYNVKVSTPPVIPDTGYDLIILYNINPTLYISAINDELDSYLERGNYLMIYGSDTARIDKINKYIPYEFKDRIKETQSVQIKNVSFLKDTIIFSVDEYDKTVAKINNTIREIARTSDNSTLMSLSSYHDGTVFYYGVADESSNLPNSIDYPLTMDRIVKYLTKYDEFGDLNKDIGDIASGSDIKTPDNLELKGSVILTTPGFYIIDDDSVAVNYLNQYESDFTRKSEIDTFLLNLEKSEEGAYFNKDKMMNFRYPLYIILIVLALLFVLYEVYFIKYRGDI